MSGGGSGGSGTQRYDWNDVLGPQWGNAISWARGLTDPNGAGAYHQYQGAPIHNFEYNQQGGISGMPVDQSYRIAGLNRDQTVPMDEIRGLNYGTSNPLGTINDAMAQTQRTLDGNYLTGPGANPYSRGNSWETQTNQYIGNSPQFNSMLHQGQEDIANAYQRGTAADTTRGFARAGVLGSTANDNAVAANEYGLARGLGNYTSGMQNDQFNRSAGLQEQELQRRGGLAENFLNRGSQNYENERQRQMGAIGLGNDQQSLALQRAQSLAGTGDAQRSYIQDLLNQQYGDWQGGQNRQYQMLDTLTGILSRAQGGMAPNSYQTTAGYQASPLSQLFGAGLLGNQIFGGRSA